MRRRCGIFGFVMVRREASSSRPVGRSPTRIGAGARDRRFQVVVGRDGLSEASGASLEGTGAWARIAAS